MAAFHWAMAGRLILALLCSLGCVQLTSIQEPSPPSLTSLPRPLVSFSNSSGARLECIASGHPPPKVTWLASDDTPLIPIPTLRQIEENTLLFSPFDARHFRQDVHATSYKCKAQNIVGTIASYDVYVKAVILQPYDVYVYDVFATTGNTAVFLCHVPNFLINHVSVIAWIRDSVMTINADILNKDSKYTLVPSGALYVKNVEPSDAKTTFRCQTKNLLTGEIKTSTTTGKLFVTDTQSSVVPKIVFSKKSSSVKAGDTAFLSCESQGNPTPIIKWEKKSPFGLHPVNLKQHTTISGSLILKETQMSDAGLYTCTATNSVGTDKTETLVTVTENLSAAVDPKTATVDGGQSATFVCKVQGSPVSTIQWLKDGSPISGNAFQMTTPKNRTLHVRSVSSKLAGVYQCLVSNEWDAAFGQAVLQLGDVPPSILSGFDEKVLQPGSSVSLECTVSGNPVPTLSWSLDNTDITVDKRITHTQSVDSSGSSVSQLTIRQVRVEDGGLYKCQAINKVGNTYQWARLNVFGPLAVRHGGKAYVVTGEQAILNCPIYGYPIRSITWHTNEIQLPMDPRQKVLINGSLIIENAYHGADSGNYNCVAQDEAGRKVSGDVFLIVMVPPKLAPFSFQEELVREGMRGRLQCVVLEGDLPLTLNWLKNDLPIQSYEGLNVRHIDDFSSILTIASISPRHNGNYTCQASNPAATVSFTTRLAVNVPPKILPFAFQDDQFFKGMRAHIICAVSQGDLPLHFQWLKDGKPILPSLDVVTRSYDGHANSLSIESVSSSHTGNYTCVVSNAGATVSHTAQLLVYVSPKIIPFSFPNSGVTEGVLARISCVVYQGDLPLTLNWLKDGQPVALLTDVLVRRIDDYSSILTIERTLSYHAGNYTCQASNAASTASHSSPLVVKVPPKIVPFTFPDEPLLEGMLVRVSCVVSRGDLPLTISWFKDNYALPGDLASVSIRDFDEYSSVLSIDPLGIEHVGNYACKAKNHAATVSHTAHLRVQVPPKWLVKPNHSEINSGGSVFIHCQADGLPKPTVSWSKLNDDSSASAVTESFTTTIMPNGTLRMRNISKNEEGKYFCTASNNVGRPLAWGAEVKVLAPPHFEQKRSNIKGKKGENLTLSCSATGDTPISFVWALDSQSIDPDLNTRYEIKSNFHNQSTLLIKWLDRKDSNSFVCKAENRFGSDEKMFSVIVQEPPELPEILTQVKSRNRSISILWKAPFDGQSPIVHYIIQYKREIDNWQLRSNVSVSGHTTSAVISGLQPANTYQFRVAAENIIGVSDFSETISGRTEDDIPTSSPQNIEVESMDQHTLRITWKPPRKSQWNGPIRGYNIGWKIEGSETQFEYSTLEVPEDYTEDLIYQLTNLKMFSLYAIVISAYNSKGQGPESEPVVAMTSEDVPSSPPVGIRCSALSARSIYVLWDPPAVDTTFGILRGYKVLYKPVKEWYDTGIQVKVTQTTKATLQDLQVNTNYTFQVLAYTKVGDGVKSTPVYCKTHEDVPEAPASIKVLPSSSDSVVVAWKSPKISHGSVTKYNVYYKALASGEEKLNLEDTSSALMSEQVAQEPSAHVARAEAEFMEVKGLKKNQKYAFWVTASSVIGEGHSSDIMAQTVAESTVSAKSASFDDKIKTPWKRDVILPCRAVGVPTPQRKWKLGSKLIEVTERRVILSDGTLILNKVDSEDSGNYTCTIYNELGKDEVKYSVSIQVPPAAPMLDIISKARSSFQLQWKAGPNGGDNVRGFVLHYRRDQGAWETKELRPDQEIYTLDGLACGSVYQLYIEAFNSIGNGAPCDVITISTEGRGEHPPSKESLIREEATFATLYLEAWPSKGCPVEHFQVEYKPLQSKEWTMVSDRIRPTQRKLVIPGLTSATWYVLRLTAVASGGSTSTEYQFATHTTSGGTIPPPEIRIEKTPEAVYVFYLDPTVFIPAVALLIIVIIASVVICVWVKRKYGSEASPSGSNSTLNTWKQISRPVYGVSGQNATMGRRREKDQGLYATVQVPGCFADPNNEFFLANPELVPFDPRWTGTMTTRRPHRGNPVCSQRTQQEGLQQSANNGINETTFVFGPSEIYGGCPPIKPQQDYDQPPHGM